MKNKLCYVIPLAILLILYASFNAEVVNGRDHAGPVEAAVGSPVPPCERNVSVEKLPGFKNYTDELKDVLYYAHCREYRQLLDAPEKCAGAPADRPLLLIVVKTTPWDRERRDAIRLAYGREGEYNGVVTRRAFIMGTGGGSDAAALQWESRRHRDILQWDFREAYFNLTVKQIQFWRWWKLRCSESSFVMMVDHDVFVNTFNLASYVATLNASEHLYAGDVFPNSRIMREGPWEVPEYLLEGTFYPTYVSGAGVLYSRRSAAALDGAMSKLVVHNIDDAYIGQALLSVGVTPSAVHFLRFNVRIRELVPCTVRHSILYHLYYPPEIVDLWRAMTDPHLKCSEFKSRYPDQNVVLVFPIRDRMVQYARQMEHLKAVVRPKWNVTVVVVEQGDSGPFRRGWLLNVGIALAARRFGSDTCVVAHDVSLAVSPLADYGACDVPTQVCSELSCYGGGLPYYQFSGGVMTLSLRQWKEVNGYTNLASGRDATDDFLHRLRAAGLVDGSVPRRPPREFGNCTCMDGPVPTTGGSDREASAAARPEVESLGRGGRQWASDGLSTLRYDVLRHSFDEYGSEWWTVVEREPPAMVNHSYYRV